MSYKKIYMSFNIKRHIHARVIFSRAGRWAARVKWGGEGGNNQGHFESFIKEWVEGLWKMRDLSVHVRAPVLSGGWDEKHLRARGRQVYSKKIRIAM